MKKCILFLLALASANLAIAAPRYIPLSPEHVVMSPKMPGTISLSNLEKYTPYDVICIIASQGEVGQKFVSVQPSFDKYSLSGKDLSGIIKLPIKNVSNEYVLRTVVADVSKVSTLEFTNLDDDSAVEVYNCVAERHFGGGQNPQKS